MAHYFDRIAKTLADGVSRRQALWRLGGVMAGAFGLSRLARGGPSVAACNAYCNRFPSPSATATLNCRTTCLNCPTTAQMTGATIQTQACSVDNGTFACTYNTGNCTLNCSSGYANCANNPVTSGCTTHISADPSNCGSCGTVCGLNANVASVACISSSCAIAACNPGYSDCDQLYSDGCEVNTLTSNSNCGACGTVCLSGQTCSNGACVTNCGTNDVSYGGHCYYLDGSGGACDPGYSLASQEILSSIASLFAGKNYKHTVSGNCCIYNSDGVENWGMVDHCNTPGPFDSSEPALHGANCAGVEILDGNQLTLCMK